MSFILNIIRLYINLFEAFIYLITLFFEDVRI